jgi:hypothetical protein
VGALIPGHDAGSTGPEDGIATTTEDLGWFRVEHTSSVGGVRRAAMGLADRLGFTEERTGEVGIVVSELAGSSTPVAASSWSGPADSGTKRAWSCSRSTRARAWPISRPPSPTAARPPGPSGSVWVRWPGSRGASPFVEPEGKHEVGDPLASGVVPIGEDVRVDAVEDGDAVTLPAVGDAKPPLRESTSSAPEV